MKDLLKRKVMWLCSPKALIILGGDALVVALSWWASFALRFGNQIPVAFWDDFKQTFVIVIFIRLIVFSLFGLYRGFWRYASISDLANIFKAVSVSSIVVACVVLFHHHAHFARSILIIDLSLVLLFIGGIRFAVRLGKYAFERTKNTGNVRTVIIGANDSGETVARELLRSRRGYCIIGYVDDDIGKHGLKLHGIPVLGTRAKLPGIIKKHRVNEIIIAIPSVAGHALREMVATCHKLSSGITIKIVPSLMELIDGKLRVERLRDINIADLLNRKVVTINQETITTAITNNKILITGASGTIGSELARQVLKFKPKELILLDFNANGLFYLEKDLMRQVEEYGLQAKFRLLLGDVRNAAAVNEAFDIYRPYIVFHAAAYKHVPLMEQFPSETVDNNVFGTKNVAEASHKHGAGHFVLISTDKAVNPQNVMGTTKLISEMMIHRMSLSGSKTKFKAVRFGNVLNSSGSAMRVFKEQIMKGGPVTITHAEATRFFMTVEEAVCLVLQAASMGKGGETFLLNMGEPLKITDLARNMILLSGMEPEKDIPLTFTGLRPGEKLHEELTNSWETTVSTNHPDIMEVKDLYKELDPVSFDAKLAQLEAMVAVRDEMEVRRLLEEMIPGSADSAKEFKTV